MAVMKALTLSLLLFGTVAVAKVVGLKSEVFGTNTPPVEFGEWFSAKDALITPGVARLTVQACLRAGQEKMDEPLYTLLKSVSQELNEAFPSYMTTSEPSPTRANGVAEFQQAFGSLAGLLNVIEAIEISGNPPKPSDFIRECEARVSGFLTASASRIAPIYAGRRFPKVPAELAVKGLQLIPMTWQSLTQDVCHLEGQASLSPQPTAWKVFAWNRAMAAVLPLDEEDDAFNSALTRAPALTNLIKKWNRYASIAGKTNGESLGSSSFPLKARPIRLTGPAMGSRARSLVASFTTAWREQIQLLTMHRPYPEKPFELVSSQEVLTSLAFTHAELLAGHRMDFSQTELGMAAWWELVTRGGVGLTPYPYSDSTAAPVAYEQTATLAWLAMNAETNIRQNEKIPGIKYSAFPGNSVPQVLGNPAQYRGLNEEIQTVLAAHRSLGTGNAELPECLTSLNGWTRQAMAIPPGEITSLPATDGAFRESRFEPVIADLGLEVEDQESGSFRLHLATGYGHESERTVNGKTFRVWSPSAMVLHLPKTVSTADWRNDLLEKFEP